MNYFNYKYLNNKYSFCTASGIILAANNEANAIKRIGLAHLLIELPLHTIDEYIN